MPEEQGSLDEWLEETNIASTELSTLRLDEGVTTLNRHFELFAHQLKKRIKPDELPNDYYTQVSTGVGATAVFVEQNLTNIQNVLLNINLLDGSFSMLAKRRVQLPIYNTQTKRNLKLSTKSVIHHVYEITKTRIVNSLGKRIGKIAIGISSARRLCRLNSWNSKRYLVAPHPTA